MTDADAPMAPWIPVVGGIAVAAAVAASGAWRSIRFVRSRWPLGAAASIVLLLALQVLGGIGAWIGGSIAGWREGGGTQVDAQLLGLLGAVTLQGCAAALVLRRRMPTAAAEQPSAAQGPFRATWSAPRAALLGAAALVVAWLPVQAVGTIATSVQVALGGTPPPIHGHETLELLARGTLDGRSILLMAAVVLAVPAVEEVMFRGALLGALRRIGVAAWPAILLSAAIFSLVHIPSLVPGAMFPGLTMLLLLGIVLGWCALRTGSIAAPIAAHALFNAANLLVARE